MNGILIVLIFQHYNKLTPSITMTMTMSRPNIFFLFINLMDTQSHFNNIKISDIKSAFISICKAAPEGRAKAECGQVTNLFRKQWRSYVNQNHKGKDPSPNVLKDIANEQKFKPSKPNRDESKRKALKHKRHESCSRSRSRSRDRSHQSHKRKHKHKYKYKHTHKRGHIKRTHNC
eukprot:443614_1